MNKSKLLEDILSWERNNKEMIYRPDSFKERISEGQAAYRIRNEKLVFFKNALSSGKIPKDEKLYFVYSGKYGDGVVICSHLEYNNQYYIRSYYIKNE